MGQSFADFGVLFDIDDTLVDFAGAARSALLDVAATFGAGPPGTSAVDRRSASATPEHVLACWAVVSEREYGRYLTGELTFDEMRVVRMTSVVAEMDPSGRLGLDPVALELLRNESIFDHYRQYDDVAPVLERLGAAGVAVGVVSNSDGAYQRRKMLAAGLGDLLTASVFSGDLGVSKPDAAIFRAGADALALPAERVVYVGDRWATDAIGALRAGLSAVWVNRTGAPRPEEAAGDLAAVPAGVHRFAEVAGLASIDVEFARGLLSG